MIIKILGKPSKLCHDQNTRPKIDQKKEELYARKSLECRLRVPKQVVMKY